MPNYKFQNWLYFLLNFDEIAALMELSDGSRERRQAERQLRKHIVFNFMNRRGMQRYRPVMGLMITFMLALIITLILWIVRTPETEHLMSWDIPYLVALFAEFFILMAILLPSALYLQRSIYRDSLCRFWDEIGKLSPEALICMRALVESMAAYKLSEDEGDPAGIIGCCMDCCMIFHPFVDGPACPRCGSKNVLAAPHDPAPSYDDLRALAELLDKDA